MHVQHKCSYENIIFLLTPKKNHTENGMYLHTVYSYIYIYIIKRDALLNGKKQWGKHLPLIRMRCRIVHTQTSYQYTKLGPMEEKGSVLMYTLFKISF